MKTFNAQAYLSLREVPNMLHIRGWVETARPDDRVRFKKSINQGANPGVLMTELVITRGSKPERETTKRFKLELKGDHAKGYREINIRYDDGMRQYAIQDAIEVFGMPKIK
ncbi:hypothetical protein [Flavobacterium caeni]|uniref:Uncharacterized protein n=1 Tax=Flavobacterium caeni TaxID=490189 RepID=A0A1G5D0C1_9FLAO|nr:hypothetical protein [Flavobacterium caeni]SCY08135.1 hypothetical protein SAMN02927903_00701 [Flavobacterium caeni]